VNSTGIVTVQVAVPVGGVVTLSSISTTGVDDLLRDLPVSPRKWSN